MNQQDDIDSAPAETFDIRTGSGVGTFPHGELTNAIIGAMFDVHNVFGSGFLEAVYANALTVELRHRRVPVDRRVPFELTYRGESVGRYVADLVVDQRVLVETKVAKAIDPVHRAQVLNYLRASGLEVGLVLNFGTSAQFKRVVNTSRPRRDDISGTRNTVSPVDRNSNTNSNSNSKT